MRKVLIIEDNPNDFVKISERFTNAGWVVLPSAMEYEQYASLYNADKKNKLVEKVHYLIHENYRELGMVVLDITIFGKKDLDGLELVLPSIRQIKIDDSNYENWGSQIPIIAFSNHEEIEIKERALGSMYHVHTFISKARTRTDYKELLLTSESLYSIFIQNIGLAGGFRKNIDEMSKKFCSYLEDIQQKSSMTVEKLDDIKLLIEHSNQEFYKMFDILLFSTFEVMNSKKALIFMNTYFHELDNSGFDKGKIKRLKNDIESKDYCAELISKCKEGKLEIIVDYLISLGDSVNLFQGAIGVPVKIVALSLLAFSRAISEE